MTAVEGEKLIDRLSETHNKIRDLVKGRDLDQQVYEDGIWGIRDILGHLATWDRQVSLSLNAYRQGKEYAIPDFEEDSFNNVAFERQSKIAFEELLYEWQAARDRLIPCASC